MLDGWTLIGFAAVLVLAWAIARAEIVHRRRAEYDARREGRRDVEEQLDALHEQWWREELRNEQLLLETAP